MKFIKKSYFRISHCFLYFMLDTIVTLGAHIIFVTYTL